MGEGLLLGEVTILEYRMVPIKAGNTKYRSSKVIVDFLHGN